MSNFKEYEKLNLAATHKEVLNSWKLTNLFTKSIKNRKGNTEFTFYEGPPSANGIPGIHHVIARTIKDIFCRYKTICGYRVDRKAGWDTHGLPVELSVEKELNITKEDIGKKISISDYNNACKETVMRYTEVWKILLKKWATGLMLKTPI